jgi:hypothetical protein
MRVHTVEPEQVVVDRPFDRRHRVLADVQSEDAALLPKARALHVGDEGREPAVVEAEPVDQRVGVGQTPHSRLRVARLRQRRHRADLDEAEAERAEAVDAATVLVETGRQADAIREPQSGHRHRIIDARLADRAHQRRVLDASQRVQRQVVCLFGVETEQEGTGQCVGEEGHEACAG